MNSEPAVECRGSSTEPMTKLLRSGPEAHHQHNSEREQDGGDANGKCDG